MTTKLTNQFWDIAIDLRTGAMTRVVHSSDAHGMNWVCSPTGNLWFPISDGWGLGHCELPNIAGSAALRWQSPVRVTKCGNGLRIQYRLGPLEIGVRRRLRGARLEEEFVFRNAGKTELPVQAIRLFTPFNDNYPDAPTCVTQRCHAHLWCGGHVAYVCALRMGNVAPHLGLVLTDGFIGGYSITGRGLLTGSSNNRGTILLNAQNQTLASGQSHRIAWTMFWHTGWDDFMAQARRIPGFVEVRAAHYTVVGKERPKITVSDREARVEKPVGDTIKVQLAKARVTWLRIQQVENIARLVQQRVAFLTDRQQVLDRRSRLYGAFLPYDNDLQAQFHNPKWRDQNEGRERVGIGVLLAQAWQRWPNPKTAGAARLNHRFVRSKLQLPDGTVLDAVGELQPQRLYNYPWVALFHLEMYRAFGRARCLTDADRTLRQYYQRGGAKFYAFPIPMVDAVETFRAAGRNREATELLRLFCEHADRVVATGTRIPAHEVNYEQSIIGPATLIPLEAYLLTREEKYLQCAREFLPLLEAFNGRQPDHHLHDIGIRHWDGFWFGRQRLWGDTFPHYWSAVTGWVFYRYWQATGDESYRQRGREILLNNLSAFRPDGSASCAFIYPDAVNGNPAHCWDSLANDQDWALVFLLQAARLDPAFVSDRWS
ncbi:MAG: hypothetical protein WCH84_03485 [Verrucomicrobiota bacterium]